MSVKVEVKDGNYQITIPVKEAYENSNFRKFLELEKAEQIISKSKASDKEIEITADEIDKEYWENNKDWFLSGIDN